MNEPTHLPQQLLSSTADYDVSEEIVVVNATEDESPLDEQAVHYFIEEVLKKKKELHDPRHRCNRFFGEIRNILFAQYGLFYSVKTLERKYHYLKRQFDSMCQNKNRSSTWVFFNKMMEIFAEELDIEDAPTMASLYPDLPLPKSALPLPPKLMWKRERVVPSTKDTTWVHTIVLDFLNECVDMREAFWDPNHRRRDILVELQKRMKNKGYTFELENLDRKLRNLKCCYHGTVESMKKKRITLTGLRHPWPYFEQLHSIYDGYVENKDVINKKCKRKSTVGGGVIKKRSVLNPRTRFANKRRAVTTNAKVKNETTENTTRCSKPESLDESPEESESNFEAQPELYESFVDVNCSFSPGDFDGQEQEDDLKAYDHGQEDDSRADDHGQEDDSRADDHGQEDDSRADDHGEEDDSRADEPEEEDDSTVDAHLETEANINTETNRHTQTKINTETTANDEAIDFEFAKKMFILEERRTIAIEQLLEQLKESNRIRQRKVHFNQMKLSYLKARAKSKEFV